MDVTKSFDRRLEESMEVIKSITTNQMQGKYWLEEVKQAEETKDCMHVINVRKCLVNNLHWLDTNTNIRVLDHLFAIYAIKHSNISTIWPNINDCIRVKNHSNVENVVNDFHIRAHTLNI